MSSAGRRCGPSVRAILATLAAITVAPHARADSGGPLTELVDAAAQRLQVAEPVAAVKWKTHGAIEDPGRVQEEMDELNAAAQRLDGAAHIDPGYVTRVFGDQISATEAVEYGRFADWKLNPATAPAAPPDLSALRSTIDGLNQTMLAQIAADWGVLHSSECAARLDAARDEVAVTRRLDGLYQRALVAATRSYCQG